MTIKLSINPNAPTLNLSASPSSVVSGGNTTLTWSGSNLASCTASSSPATSFSGSRSASGGSEQINSITVDNEGNSYLTGAFNGDTNLGGYEFTSFGGLDIFIGKLGPDGKNK